MGARTVAAIGLGVLAACSGGQSTPTSTELRFSGTAPRADFLVEYAQSIGWGSADLERNYSARFSLTAIGMDGGQTRLLATLDSLSVVHATPHGRGLVDARHLVGVEFELSLPAKGGRPAYPENTPVLLMPGNLEGELSVSRFMDFAFPALPEDAVGTGDSWTGESTHPHVEAHVHTTAAMTTEYQLTGWEVVDGVECARIEGRMAGEVTAAPSDLYGSTVEFTGTIEGEFTWMFDPTGGALVSVEGQTTSDGTLTVDGEATPIRQQTQIRIAR